MPPYEQRQPRWHEALLYNGLFQILVGLTIVVILPATLVWGWDSLSHLNSLQRHTLLAAAASFTVSSMALKRMARFAGGDVPQYIASTVTLVYLLAFAIVIFTRSDYSRGALLIAYFFTLLLTYTGYFIWRRYSHLRYAVVPNDMGARLKSTSRISIHHLVRPTLDGGRFDAVVADLKSGRLKPEWERFLAECALAQIPLLDIRQLNEHSAGKVCIHQLSGSAEWMATPASLYGPVKRLIDIAGALFVLLLVWPVMLLAALAIRLDSPGPALFKQLRLGMNNTEFKVYKFRSMTLAKGDISRLQGSDEKQRITRIGAFIRKTRIDELPQLWNVLKGDMSLIGPRPEWKLLACEYEKDIPFYSYRHVVRPGITGLAQVMQGYAWDVDDTKEKIEYDFYYIKHFSFWLDVLIVLKTLKVIVTGWGAR